MQASCSVERSCKWFSPSNLRYLTDRLISPPPPGPFNSRWRLWLFPSSKAFTGNIATPKLADFPRPSCCNLTFKMSCSKSLIVKAYFKINTWKHQTPSRKRMLTPFLPSTKHHMIIITASTMPCRPSLTCTCLREDMFLGASWDEANGWHTEAIFRIGKTTSSSSSSTELKSASQHFSQQIFATSACGNPHRT